MREHDTSKATPPEARGRLDPGRWRRRVAVDLAGIGIVGLVGGALVGTDAGEGLARRLQALLGDRVEEAYLLLLVVLVAITMAGFRRWQQARDEANALDRALDRLRRHEQWRSDLMSALAHDIRSPLTVITGTLKTLDQHPGQLDADTQAQLVTAALRQTTRIETLTRDLLAVDRIQDGALRLDRQIVPLSAATQAAVAYLPDADVDLDVPEDLVVWADPGRLEQVLVNLLTNAVQHGAPPVMVTAAAHRGQVDVCVRDHGPGIRQNEAADVFAHFRHSSDKASLGLGLWVARRLVEAHEGQIRYEPAAPGARFVITLPHEPAET